MSFTQGQIQNLRNLTETVAEGLPAEWALWMGREADWYVVIHFETGQEPEVDGTTRYMAEHYGVGNSVPGMAKFHDYDKAVEFIGAVAQAPTVNYEAVLKAAGMIHYEGWRDAISAYVEDTEPESLPAECDGLPYWQEELVKVFGDAWTTTTVAEANAYGSHSHIHFPEAEGALLFAIMGDTGGETEVELGYIYTTCEITDGSLEDVLVRQLVCTNDTPYTYVRYDLMAACFLDPEAENAEYLEAAVRSEGFQNYYGRGVYVPGFPGRGRVDEQQEAVDEWCEAAKLPSWDIDEPFDFWHDDLFDECGERREL